MTDQKHKIKAPLKMCEYGGYVWDADNNMVADLVLSDDAKHGFVLRMRGTGRGMTAKDQEDIANRLLDCYNACEGIKNPKDFRGLRKQLKSVTKQRDELREFVIVLKRIVQPNVSKGLADDIDTAIARAKTKESV